MLITAFSLINFNRNVDRWLALCVSCFFIFIGTIKWKVGPDWGHYFNYFNYVCSQPSPAILFEPIYSSFFFLAKNTFQSFIVVQFLQVCICVICKYSSFKRYTKYILLAMFLNYCFYLADMFTVRNFLAGAIAFWGCKYIEEKKPIKFLITIIVATNIHVAAIIMILAYPLYNLKLSIHAKVIALIISVSLGVSGIFTQLVSKSSFFVSVFSDRVSEKLSIYSEIGNSAAEKAHAAGLILILGIIKRLVFLPIIFYYESSTYNGDKRFRGMSNLFVFANFIYFLTLDFKVFQRLSIPFYIFEIPLLLLIYDKAKNKLLYFILFSIYGFSKLLVVVTGPWMSDFVTIFNSHVSTYWDKH